MKITMQEEPEEGEIEETLEEKKIDEESDDEV